MRHSEWAHWRIERGMRWRSVTALVSPRLLTHLVEPEGYCFTTTVYCLGIMSDTENNTFSYLFNCCLWIRYRHVGVEGETDDGRISIDARQHVCLHNHCLLRKGEMRLRPLLLFLLIWNSSRHRIPFYSLSSSSASEWRCVTSLFSRHPFLFLLFAPAPAPPPPPQFHRLILYSVSINPTLSPPLSSRLLALSAFDVRSLSTESRRVCPLTRHPDMSYSKKHTWVVFYPSFLHYLHIIFSPIQ